MNLADISTADSETVSLPDRVVQRIVRGILNGRYVPGQKLVEADLLQHLNVSRGPVREAFKRLHGEGVVSLTRHRGAHIRALSRNEAGDLIVILEALTCLSARLAATAVRDGANVRKLKEAFAVLESIRDASPQDTALIGKRRSFYDALMEIGGNTQLPSLMPILLIHLLRAQSQPFWTEKDRKNVFAEYSAVTNAVLSGDPAKAERAMRRHMEAAAERLSRLPDEAFPSI